VNASFENDFTGWTTAGSPGAAIVASDVAGTNGTKIVKFNSNSTPADGAVMQTFPTVVGSLYTVTFDMGVIAYNTSQQRMQVTATGTSALATQTFSITGLGAGAVRWATQTLSFTANSSSTTLTFRDVSTTGSGLDLLLDHVRISTGNFTTGPNLIANGSFELSPDYSGWTQTGGTRLEKPGAIYTTSGNNILSFNVGTLSTGGMVSQSFATTPGAIYELNFDVGTLGYNTNQQRLRTVITGSGPLLSQISTVTCRADFVMVWVHQTFSFMANSSTTTLTFTDVSTTSSGLDLFVDTVTLNQTAAPVTVSAPAPAMMAMVLPSPDAESLSEKPSIQPATTTAASGISTSPTGTPTITKGADGFTITLPVTEPGLYTLERCDDLRSWKHHSGIEITEPGSIEFKDTETGNDRMFYRVGFQSVE
jgi:hypothetical protein